MRARGSLRDALRISEYVKGEMGHPGLLCSQQTRVQSSAVVPYCMQASAVVPYCMQGPKGRVARELSVQAPSIASSRPAQRNV